MFVVYVNKPSSEGGETSNSLSNKIQKASSRIDKRSWIQEEDDNLKQLVEIHGTSNWLDSIYIS
jgi:hypothetical protein